MLHAHGKAGHSGYPWLSLSANTLLVEALGILLQLEHELPYSEKYGNTTVNIGQIAGGVAANVIAETASAKVSLRLAAGSPSDAKKAIQKALEPVIKKAEKGDGKFEIEWGLEGYGPVYLDHDIEGFEPVTVNYGTDVPNLDGEHKRYLYGPGTILVAHSATAATSLSRKAIKERSLSASTSSAPRNIVQACAMKSAALPTTSASVLDRSISRCQQSIVASVASPFETSKVSRQTFFSRATHVFSPTGTRSPPSTCQTSKSVTM